jgi:glutamate-1-semialdehyde 2,1-aminomutase
MIDKNVPAYLAEKGKILKQGYNKIAEELNIIQYTKCIGYDCRSMITFDASAGNTLELKSFVQQELIKKGILWSGFHNMSFSHTDEDINYTLKAYSEVLKLLKDAIENSTVTSLLKGKPVEPVFRKVSNFNTKPKMANG